MTLLEYIKALDKEERIIYSDGYSNGVYLDLGQLYKSKYKEQIALIIYPILTDLVDCPLYRPSDGTEDIRYIDGQHLEFLTKTNIIIDKEVSEYDSYTRRPYFRLRGPRVTEEQAFEIIRRTDRFFQWHLKLPETIYITHFPNWWFNKNHYPKHYGWCHPNGIIGLNGITDKYPRINELIDDIIQIKYAFPYLDFVIGITDWNEIHPDAWNYMDKIYDTINNKEEYEKALDKLEYWDYPDFIDNIKIGIWVHEDTIEFMAPSRAKQIYKEYTKKYEDPNKDIYIPEYYQDRKLFTANNEYLKRCIQAAGIRPEEVLPNVEEYIWEDKEDSK